MATLWTKKKASGSYYAQSRLTYTVTNSTTYTTIAVSKLELYVNIGWEDAFTFKYYSTGTLQSGNSHLSNSKSYGETQYAKGNYYTVLGAQTKTFKRTTYAYTITLHAEMRADGITYPGTVNITIPALPTYTVTWNANGGEPATQTTTVYYGESSYAPSTPIQTGYNFSGWSLGNPVTNVTSNITNTAYWSEKTANLTYNNAGLSSTLPSPNPQSQSYTAVTVLKAASAAGYTHKGWATSDANAKAGSNSYAPNATYKSAYVIPSTVTLYATWYGTLTYNANGHGVAPESVIMYYNTAVTGNSGIEAIGYDFGGWYTNTGGTGTNYADEIVKSVNSYKENTTLYAKWIPHSLIINYYGNGAKYDDQSGERQPVENQLLLTTDAKYDGTEYRIDGLSNANGGTWKLLKDYYHASNLWHINSGDSVDIISADTPYALTQDLAAALGVLSTFETEDVSVNLYTDFIPNTYTVNYHGNGSSGGSTAASVHTYNESKRLNTNGFIRPGYTFDHWSSTDSTQSTYSDEAYITNIYPDIKDYDEGEVNLYAEWRPNSYVQGEYTFDVIADLEVRARVTDTTKASYSEIPVTCDIYDKTVDTSVIGDKIYYQLQGGQYIVVENPTGNPYELGYYEKYVFNVTSVEECFKDCTNLVGDIFINHTPMIYTNMFQNTTSTNEIYILSKNRNISHDTWKTIANTYSNVTYLGADNDYSYVVLGSGLHAKVLNVNKTSYSQVPTSLQGGSTWNIVSMDSCFEGCVNLVNIGAIPTYVTSMNRCFKGCNSLQGNITVYNAPQSGTYVDIFANTNNNIYIINGLIESTRSVTKEAIAESWRAIASGYDNVHYEADDIVLDNSVIFTVNRRFYSNDTLETPLKALRSDSADYTGAYLRSTFDLPLNQVQYLPIGWSLEGKELTVTIGEYSHTSQNITTSSTDITFNNVGFFFDNTEDAVTLEMTYTIKDNRNDLEVVKVYETRVDNGTTVNKKILKVDYKDNKYIYNIQEDAEDETVKVVSARFFDKTQDTCVSLSNEVIINGVSFKITDLYYPLYSADGSEIVDSIGGCYENCERIVHVDSLPLYAINLTNCFKNCKALRDNIIVNCEPLNYNNIFTDTTNSIFIVNSGEIETSPQNPTIWRTIGNGTTYTNVFYEGDHNSSPASFAPLISRGLYNTELEEWTEDDSGSWIKADITISLQNDYLPINWVNLYIKQFVIVVREIKTGQDILLEHEGEDFFVDDYSFNQINSKTLDTSTTYYIRIPGAYVYKIVKDVVGKNPQAEGWYEFVNNTYILTTDTIPVAGKHYYKRDYAYEKVLNPTASGLKAGLYYVKCYNTSTAIYFENPFIEQSTMTLEVTDFYNHKTPGTQTIYATFAMLDFLPGGQGMAIGKVSRMNGLEVGLPTAIGLELDFPTTVDYRITKDKGELGFVSLSKSETEGKNPKAEGWYELISGVYTLTEDTVPVERKTYYIHKTYYYYDTSVEPPEYKVVVNPTPDGLSTYYEAIDVTDLSTHQLVIGQYNEVDSDAILIIGNGTANSDTGIVTRSNLLTISNEEMSLSVPIEDGYFKRYVYLGLNNTAPAGSEDYKLRNAIYSLGWEDLVIEPDPE